MADVLPFRALRYDIGQVGDLTDVVCPPYDVIDQAQQNELYKKHPCNVIRVELNRDEPGDTGPDDKYARAARYFRQWQQDGVLMREQDDALYVYHQEFEWEGRTYVRKGFFGRLKLEEFGKGCVYPHEQTLSGPKKDRLSLIRACQTNLSPVFGLYPDEEGNVQTPLEAAALKVTPLVAQDHLGVTHRMWPVTDRAAIQQAVEAMADKPIFIADGHHRYETGCNYRNELLAAGKIDGSSPANYILMMFIGMEDPGLQILPTHRLISGFPDLTEADVRAALSSHFSIETVASADEAWETMDLDGAQTIFGIGTPADGQWLLIRAADTSPMKTLAADQSDDWRGLGVSILHRMIVDHLLKSRYPQAEPAYRFVHLMDEVQSAMADRSCQVAILVNPARISHVREISAHLERMPPKSTYFYPKLLSGLVFNPLT